MNTNREIAGSNMILTMFLSEKSIPKEGYQASFERYYEYKNKFIFI